MATMYLFLNLILLNAINGLPVSDDEVTDYIDNSIDDSDVIDLSNLQPQAFGTPKNESGKTFSISKLHIRNKL